MKTFNSITNIDATQETKNYLSDAIGGNPDEVCIEHMRVKKNGVLFDFYMYQGFRPEDDILVYSSERGVSSVKGLDAVTLWKRADIENELTFFEPGTKLFTKDGRIIGNCSVSRFDGINYIILNERGNEVRRMTKADINAVFYLC